MRVGDPVGRPLAEWAYYSPRRTDGICLSELTESRSQIQRETALLWFCSNYTPYDLGDGPYFGLAEAEEDMHAASGVPFGDGSRFSDGAGIASSGGRPKIAGLDQGVFAPSPLSADQVLRAEFADHIGEAVYRDLATSLPGDWMRVHDDLSNLPVLNAEALSPDSLMSTLFERIVQLEGELSKLSQPHAGIGHNSGTDELPLSKSEGEEAAHFLNAVGKDLASDLSEKPDRIVDFVIFLKTLHDKISPWLIGQLNTSFTEINKSISKRAAELLVAYMALQHVDEILDLLFRIFRVQ